MKQLEKIFSLFTLHNDDRKLVGRAVTCTYCPTRPDLHDLQFARSEEYRDLDWSKEYDLARNGDPNDTQTML